MFKHILNEGETVPKAIYIYGFIKNTYLVKQMQYKPRPAGEAAKYKGNEKKRKENKFNVNISLHYTISLHTPCAIDQLYTQKRTICVEQKWT